MHPQKDKKQENGRPKPDPGKKRKDPVEKIKKNPNPRANGNLPEGDKTDAGQTKGVGSEITDGEDG
ncbi:MAG TPA: hypothetical protein VK644_02485 [Chitinophagaceae bacterium]|nr:hypothetical protein [Chitinophagaceae bacterium]